MAITVPQVSLLVRGGETEDGFLWSQLYFDSVDERKKGIELLQKDGQRVRAIHRSAEAIETFDCLRHQNKIPQDRVDTYLVFATQKHITLSQAWHTLGSAAPATGQQKRRTIRFLVKAGVLSQGSRTGKNERTFFVEELCCALCGSKREPNERIQDRRGKELNRSWVWGAAERTYSFCIDCPISSRLCHGSAML